MTTDAIAATPSRRAKRPHRTPLTAVDLAPVLDDLAGLVREILPGLTEDAARHAGAFLRRVETLKNQGDTHV